MASWVWSRKKRKPPDPVKEKVEEPVTPKVLSPVEPEEMLPAWSTHQPRALYPRDWHSDGVDLQLDAYRRVTYDSLPNSDGDQSLPVVSSSDSLSS